MLLAVGVARQKYPPTPKLILFKKVKDKFNHKLEQNVFFNKLYQKQQMIFVMPDTLIQPVIRYRNVSLCYLCVLWVCNKA